MSASYTTSRLRDLIRCVRLCKTAAAERELVQKECAHIRCAFSEDKPHLRTHNMLKLLYIAMLGYPTEFGQMEVVKLLAQPDFAGKRIGYLTLQMVLDENDEVLTLAENHMKNDLSNAHAFVQALALNAAANIAGEDMARDILDEVLKLVESRNTYLRKKACLTAARIVEKAPEHAETFLDSLVGVFNERNYATLLSSLTLVNRCLQTEAGARFLSRYRQQVTPAVRALKHLVLSSRITDQDVNGISDPFLQVRILQFMRIIGTDSAVVSEALNDVLAQVITNTDASRSVGCAVLYECVKTINAIESDADLRTLGINTIGRFLSSVRDNNLRFVALELLNGFVHRDAETVQKLQTTIIDCLKDVDVSIRRRALDLTIALIDDSNVRLFVPDLVTYLGYCTDDMKELVTCQLCKVVEEKAPSSEWRVELSLRLLKLGRQHVPIDFAPRLIALITRESVELQPTAVRALWDEASYPFDALSQSRRALLITAVWCIGEYAELIVDQGKATADAVAACIAEITTNTNYNLIKKYGLTSLMKIASKYPIAKVLALPVFEGYSTSLDCELQQRACEYTTLLEHFGEEAKACFARMPPIETHGEVEDVHPIPVVLAPQAELEKPPAHFIDDLFGGPGEGSISSVTSQPANSLPGLPAQMPPARAVAPTANSNLEDLFGTPGPSPALPVGGTPSPTPAQPPAAEAYRCGDLVASIVASMSGTQIVTSVIIKSLASVPLTDFSFQVAVPKLCTVDVAPLPSTEIRPSSSMTQDLTVNNANNTKNPRGLMLRIRLAYSRGGELQEHLFQVAKEV